MARDPWRSRERDRGAMLTTRQLDWLAVAWLAWLALTAWRLCSG